MWVLLTCVIFTDCAFVFDVSVILMILVNEVIYNLCTTVGQLYRILAFGGVSISFFMS
jgi:hypothetical protein